MWSWEIRRWDGEWRIREMGMRFMLSRDGRRELESWRLVGVWMIMKGISDRGNEMKWETGECERDR